MFLKKINDRDQLEEYLLQRDEGDVGGPGLIHCDN